MNATRVSLLIDTNIWLDYFIPDRPYCKQARALINCALNRRVNLLYTSPIAKDVFYMIRTHLKNKEVEQNGTLTDSQAIACRELAWGYIDNMTNIALAVPCGEPEVWLARQYRKLHPDFEDNLVLGSLETSQATYLVTNDETLRAHAPKAAFSAEDMLKLLQVG